MTKSYILGALHDGTTRKSTFRIAQKSEKCVKLIAKSIQQLGGHAWVYREGKSRNLFIVEFSKSFLKGVSLISQKDKIEYLNT